MVGWFLAIQRRFLLLPVSASVIQCEGIARPLAQKNVHGCGLCTNFLALKPLLNLTGAFRPGSKSAEMNYSLGEQKKSFLRALSYIWSRVELPSLPVMKNHVHARRHLLCSNIHLNSPISSFIMTNCPISIGKRGER